MRSTLNASAPTLIRARSALVPFVGSSIPLTYFRIARGILEDVACVEEVHRNRIDAGLAMVIGAEVGTCQGDTEAIEDVTGIVRRQTGLFVDLAKSARTSVSQGRIGIAFCTCGALSGGMGSTPSAYYYTVVGQERIIEIHQPTPVSIHDLVIFFLRAVERFRAHASHYALGGDQIQNESRASGAVCEALNWSTAIDNYLGSGPRDTMGTTRDADWAVQLDGADGEFVRAFRFARNYTHHRWMNLMGTRIFSEGIGRPNEWFWRPVTERGIRARDSRAVTYERHLRGAEVLGTLDRLGSIFWTLRGWQIPRSAVVQPGYAVGSSLVFDPEISE